MNYGIQRGVAMNDTRIAKELCLAARDVVAADELMRVATLTLGKADKAVIDAFIDGNSAESKKLITDGRRLDGLWMGGNGLASNNGGNIVLGEGRPHVKSDEVVIRALKKMTPRSYYKGSAADRWLTREQVAAYCPSCADRMAVRGIRRIRASVLGETMRQAAKWKGSLPKGWTSASVEKFWNSMTGEVKHKVTKCIKEMTGNVDDAGAFCASLADRVEGKGWRSD